MSAPRTVRQALSKRIRIPLTSPVEFDGVRYAEFRMREAKPRDLGYLDPTDSLLALGVTLTARLCGVPEAVVYALDLEDAERVGNQADALISRIV